VNLIGIAQPVPPPWEPEQGWRVLTPDCQQVSAGGQTIIRASVVLGELFGIDPDELHRLREIARRERR